MLSLRLRLNLAAALVLLVFIVLTALALERAFRESALASMEERLMAQIYLLMAATELSEEGEPLLPTRLNEARLELPASGLYARIDDAQGNPLWRSSSLLGSHAQGFALPEQAQNEARAFGPEAEGEHFVATLRVEWETRQGRFPLRFSIAEDGQAYHQQMQGYRHSLWAWLGGMAALLLLVLTAALAWGLRPLRRVVGEIHAIEAGQQQDLQGQYPSEIRQLSDNINTLLQHERAQQARYRHAMGDLAHSLKTPLAVLRSLPQRPALLDEQIERMDHIVQYQLQRAATAGRSALAAPLPVQASVTRLANTLQKVYADRAIVLEQRISAKACFRGDEGDLLELLGNLLDNACKWSKHTVRITAQMQDGRLALVVEDDGPGIAADQVEKVLQRGSRLDEATPGHGIGMAMVRDIVAAYQGELSIERSALGGAAIHIFL